MKECYQNTDFFSSLPDAYAVEYDAATGEVSLTNNGGAANICFAVAEYGGDGRMVSCQIRSGTLNAAERVSLTLSGVDGEARAFVLDADTFRPLRAKALLTA